MNQLDSPLPNRQQLQHLEHAVRQELVPIAEVLEHHFIKGVYLRKLTLPAGAVIVGKIHSTEHICIVAKGHILVVSEHGRKELHAGDVFVSPPGVKRAGYAITECVFINVHTNEDDETDLDILEAKYIEPEAQITLDKVEVLT